MSPQRRLFLIAFLAGGLCPALRAREPMVTEVITAGFRPAEELAAVLRPLVPPPGTVTSFGGQLVIKATPTQLAEIRTLLATLDRAPANLMISVRHDLDEEIRRDLASGYARIEGDDLSVRVGERGRGGGLVVERAGSGGSVGARIGATTRATRSRDEQRLRVLEGREAFIRSGTDVPTSEHRVIVGSATVRIEDSTSYRSADTGFYVRPTLTGDGRVVLDVRPQRARHERGGVAVRESTTTLSAPLGRWVAIGGAGGEETITRSGIGSRADRTASETYAVYVKVERLAD